MIYRSIVKLICQISIVSIIKVTVKSIVEEDVIIVKRSQFKQCKVTKIVHYKTMCTLASASLARD